MLGWRPFGGATLLPTRCFYDGVVTTSVFCILSCDARGSAGGGVPRLPGRFYAAADAMLGMTPTAWRRGGAAEFLRTACAAASLGRVLVAYRERGTCTILLGDDEAALHADRRARFPQATLAPGGEENPPRGLMRRRPRRAGTWPVV